MLHDAFSNAKRAVWGSCGHTRFGVSSCTADDTRGSFGQLTLSECASRCAGCSQCNFLSYNVKDSDCSFFSQCKRVSRDAKNPSRTWQTRLPNGSLLLPLALGHWRGSRRRAAAAAQGTPGMCGITGVGTAPAEYNASSGSWQGVRSMGACVAACDQKSC